MVRCDVRDVFCPRLRWFDEAVAQSDHLGLPPDGQSDHPNLPSLATLPPVERYWQTFDYSKYSAKGGDFAEYTGPQEGEADYGKWLNRELGYPCRFCGRAAHKYCISWAVDDEMYYYTEVFSHDFTTWCQWCQGDRTVTKNELWCVELLESTRFGLSGPDGSVVGDPVIGPCSECFPTFS